MTIRSRIEAFQGAEIVLVTDSLGSAGFDGLPGWTRLLPTLLAAKDPNARVVLRTLDPNAGGLLMPDIIVQPGSTTPSQTIRVVRDAWSGSGIVSRWATSNHYLFSWAAHYCVIALGVNDAPSLGTAGHTGDEITNSLYSLANKAKNTAGAQVTLVTPAWFEIGFGDTYSAPCAAIASYVRYIARKNNWGCVDARKMAEDHYTGTGNAGQGVGVDAWFPTDNAHFGAPLHALIAAEHMKLMGWT